MIGGLISVIACLTFLIITAEMDPGIIPRSSEAEKPLRAYTANNTFNGYGHSSHNVSAMLHNFPFRQLLNVDGHPVTYKWCITCKVARPPRSFHCQVCNNCIEVSYALESLYILCWILNGFNTQRKSSFDNLIGCYSLSDWLPLII